MQFVIHYCFVRIYLDLSFITVNNKFSRILTKEPQPDYYTRK